MAPETRGPQADESFERPSAPAEEPVALVPSPAPVEAAPADVADVERAQPAPTDWPVEQERAPESRAPLTQDSVAPATPPTDAPVALAPTPTPVETAFAAPVEPKPRAEDKSDDLAFLDEARPPEAEPEADFSWLDAPEPAEDEADDAPASDTPLAPAEAAIVAGDGGSLAEARLPVDPAAPIQEAAPISAIAAEDTSERDEFAWLDAPLPPEEPSETATSSALGSDAPDRADVAMAAAAGALPGLVSPPLSPLRQPTDGEGWALRERQRAEAAAASEPRKPFFQRLREGLARSSNQLSGQIPPPFTTRTPDEKTLQE
ncbi:cell division protein FtsY, partial [Aureimonas ureilytica]